MTTVIKDKNNQNWEQFFQSWLSRLEYLEDWEYAAQHFQEMNQPDLFRWIWMLYSSQQLENDPNYSFNGYGILRFVLPVEESSEHSFGQNFLQFFREFTEVAETEISKERHHVYAREQWKLMSEHESDWFFFTGLPIDFHKEMAPHWLHYDNYNKELKRYLHGGMWHIFCKKLFNILRDTLPHVVSIFPF
jgi:hypothetical protein